MDSRIIYCIYREVGPLTTGVDAGELYITMPVLDIQYSTEHFIQYIIHLTMDSRTDRRHNKLSEYPPVFSRTERGNWQR